MSTNLKDFFEEDKDADTIIQELKERVSDLEDANMALQEDLDDIKQMYYSLLDRLHSL